MKKILIFLAFLGINPISHAEMGLFSPTGGIPIDITSDDGIEIDRINKVITASGDAKIIREDVTLYADKLIAYYEEDEDKNTIFWRVDAKGNLKITSPQGQLTAQNGAYDVKQEIIVVYGSDEKPIKIKGEQGRAQASRQLEYYATERRIIARGDVIAIQDDQQIRAEVVEIILRNKEETQDDVQATKDINALAGDVEQIRAYNDIIMETPDGSVTGDRAIWFAQTQKANITGNVQIKQGNSVLNGCRGEVNTKTQSARLIGGDCEQSDGRISGQFKNEDK